MSINLDIYIKVNPFKPNGISHCYQLDQSISFLRVFGLYFSFLFKFCKRTVEPDQESSSTSIF